jgi:hypothetical protein
VSRLQHPVSQAQHPRLRRFMLSGTLPEFEEVLVSVTIAHTLLPLEATVTHNSTIIHGHRHTIANTQ